MAKRDMIDDSSATAILVFAVDFYYFHFLTQYTSLLLIACIVKILDILRKWESNLNFIAAIKKALI